MIGTVSLSVTTDAWSFDASCSILSWSWRCQLIERFWFIYERVMHHERLLFFRGNCFCVAIMCVIFRKGFSSGLAWSLFYPDIYGYVFSKLVSFVGKCKEQQLMLVFFFLLQRANKRK